MKSFRVVSALLFCAGLLAGQTNRGGISGTVVDASGGTVPGATIIVKNNGTNQETRTKTSSIGSFNVGNLDPVTYSVTAEAAGFSVVRDLLGHGVGYAVHEDPFVPNFGMPGQGPVLKPGMVIAIEPIFNEGSSGIQYGADGWTISTIDGSRSAHFEHTVLITSGAAEILTKE